MSIDFRWARISLARSLFSPAVMIPCSMLSLSATKEDAVEAERMSQAEFNQMMKQWQRENDRKKF